MSLQTSLCMKSNNSMVNEMPDELGVTGETNSQMKKTEKCVDSQLWLACTGSVVKIPGLDSLVYYFPDSHAEYSQSSHMWVKPPLPHYILCRVDSLKLMADPETDEVFAKIGLVPTEENHSSEEEIIKKDDSEVEIAERILSFTRTLTLSDTKGSFTIPRQCALSIFPVLNYEAEPPVQHISCMDVHGKRWTFRHIYRGSPKRHLLTGGWSTFVKQKKLEEGDSIVFLKKDNGEIHMGVMRRQCRKRSSGLEAVKEAVRKASIGQAFEAEFNPRAGTSQYLVKAATGLRAKKIPWCPWLRVKMAAESKDSWVMGTVTGVEGEDLSTRLEVTWDERPGLLQKVYAWQVEPVVFGFYMPLLPLDAPLSSPSKRICLQFFPASDNLSSMSPRADPRTNKEVETLLGYQV